MISVLLAVYNGAASVAAAIDSIRAQTHADWELLVVDDGSSDTTAQVLARFEDARIRVIRNPENRGLAASLNIAFRAASGELIARMDADDVALPHRFEVQQQFLREHPEVDVLGGGAHFLDEEATSTRRERHEDIARHILKENPFIHPAVMMRRHVLEQLGGYDESLRRAQDYDLWLRGVTRFRYHNLQQPLIRYRRPPKPTWLSSRSAARVVLRNACRQRRFARALWFASRHVVAYSVWRLTGWMRS